MSVLKVLAIMSVIASFTGFAGFAQAVERPKINLLMLEKELRNCISGQIQTKIDQIQPVHDLSNSIGPPHLELVVVCEPATVEFRDRKGRLTTVKVGACASILSESPGADINKRVKTMNLNGVGRRIHLQATTGLLSQHCQAISNQMIPRIYRWLGDGAAFK